jgi:acylphosphatase
MRVRRRVRVSGRVQGVFFRESTRRRAADLGVAGWVRNLPDGRVEAVFEGEAVAVEQAIAFACQGPPRARVTHAEISDEPPEGEAGEFEIRG